MPAFYGLVDSNESTFFNTLLGDVVLQGAGLTLPAIAIPVMRKTTFECPKLHLKALRDNLPKATRLLIIGWRATEAHFVSPLRESLDGQKLSRALVVAGQARDTNAPRPGQEVIHNLSGTVACKMEDANFGFSELMGSELNLRDFWRDAANHGAAVWSADHISDSLCLGVSRWRKDSWARRPAGCWEPSSWCAFGRPPSPEPASRQALTRAR